MRRGFTLIEVLVVIAIVGVLTILLIPNINRSLSKNNLAGDAQLLSSKIETARLLAGSTQKAEGNDAFGYYGIYLPPQTGNTFQVIRVSADPNNAGAMTLPCNANDIITNKFPAKCIVETITLSQGVTMTFAGSSYRFVLFRTPSQQAYFADDSANPGSLVIGDAPGAVFQPGIKLQYGSKTVTMNINNTTGQVSSVTYN